MILYTRIQIQVVSAKLKHVGAKKKSQITIVN